MTKGGVGLDVLLNATTRRDDQGNIIGEWYNYTNARIFWEQHLSGSTVLACIGVVGIGQDITGRLAQEREYTRLIDTANAPIFVSWFFLLFFHTNKMIAHRYFICPLFLGGRHFWESKCVEQSKLFITTLGEMVRIFIISLNQLLVFNYFSVPWGWLVIPVKKCKISICYSIEDIIIHFDWFSCNLFSMGRSLVQEFIIDDFKSAVQAVFDKALAGDETE